MSAEVQKAAINEALELSYLFRQNAALHNGLPDCKRNTVNNLDEPKPVEPPVVNITNQIPSATAASDPPSSGSTVADTVKSSLLRRAAPWLLGGAATIGGSALSAWWANRDKPAAVEQVNDGSLLQWLQDNGKHLPEGEQWPTK
jgi:hypothetical protein